MVLVPGSGLVLSGKSEVTKTILRRGSDGRPSSKTGRNGLSPPFRPDRPAGSGVAGGRPVPNLVSRGVLLQPSAEEESLKESTHLQLNHREGKRAARRRKSSEKFMKSLHKSADVFPSASSGCCQASCEVLEQ